MPVSSGASLCVKHRKIVQLYTLIICGFCSTKQHSVPKNDRFFAPQVKQLG